MSNKVVEFIETTMTNTVINTQASCFCSYFHRVTRLPLDTITYTKDLNETFFKNSFSGVSSLGTLKGMFNKYNIPYKEYNSAISVDKNVLYEFITFLILADEWYDDWGNLHRK